MLPQKSIAQINDHARRHWYAPGVLTTLLTRGVQVLAPDCDDRRELLAKVASFDRFTEDNDPHGEHDFGSLNFRGEHIFWKLDYYDTRLVGGSPDPADTNQTKRVLTIMLASEY